MTQVTEPTTAVESDWGPDERREYTRYLVDFYIRVYDERAGTLAGEVVDIGLGGMKLMAAYQLPLGGAADFRIDLSMENGYQCNMAFAATVDWVKRTEDGKQFYLGLQFARPTQAFLDVVQTIIHGLGG
jgi:PilZ domain